MARDFIQGLRAGLLLVVTIGLALVATEQAQASPGYELDASTPSRSLGTNKVPHGIAVDQASHRIYVAIATTNLNLAAPGEIDWFNSDLTSAGTLGGGSGSFYAGVAVNPVTQSFYVSQVEVSAPSGNLGRPEMQVFSSSGSLQGSFAVTDTNTLPQIATDSHGDAYFPNVVANSIQVFNSAGVLQEEITCSGCTGGAFGEPVSVALNSEDDLYVVDLAPDRLIKFTLSGGSYEFDSVLQSGHGAAAVAVDPSNDNVFAGDMPSGKGYHIAAYDSSGTQFDDFGATMFTDPPPEIGSKGAAQMGVDKTSHRLYVGDAGKFYIFNRVATAAPPTALIESATQVGQVSAIMHANVNTNGHTTLECGFEYVNDASFQINGFADATPAPCPKAPGGPTGTEVEARISGLTPATLYHYRATATTYAGSAESAAKMFETLPVTPSTVTPEAPLGVTENGATLRAKVNPHGGKVSSCRFEYGTSVSYGTNLSCLTLPEPVTADVAVSRTVSNLSPGTTYHYRLVLTSNAGTVQGGDVEFTTAAPPPPPPPAPPAPAATLEPPVTSAPPPVVAAPHPLRCKKGFKKKRVRGKLKCVKVKWRAHRGGTHR